MLGVVGLLRARTSSAGSVGCLRKAPVRTVSTVAGQDVCYLLHAPSRRDGHDRVPNLILPLIVAGVILWHTHIDQIIVDRSGLLPGKHALDLIKHPPARASLPGKSDLLGVDASVLQCIDRLLCLSALVKDSHNHLLSCCHVDSPFLLEVISQGGVRCTPPCFF